MPHCAWLTAVNTFKKHQNAPPKTQKMSKILLRRFLDVHI